MKYQPLHDLIDPDVVPENDVVSELSETDPNAPDDAYLIGEPGERFNVRIAEDPSSGRKAWVQPAAVILAVVCIALTVWNLSRLVAGPPAPPKPSAFQIKQALYLGVMKIEAYRRAHGETPGTIENAGLSNPPYAYNRLSRTEYSLGFEAAGSRLDYDSSVPKAQFFGSPQDMLKMGGSE